MKKELTYLFTLIVLVVSLSSCRSKAPRLDYKALAHASILLGVDIDMKDNHQLYIEAAKWIGVPYKGAGDTKRGTDCSGLTCQIYREVYHKRLERSTDKQKKETTKVSRRNLQEGDLVFFSSRNSGRKVAHVGIYLKNGKFIHASTSRGVIVSHLDEPYYSKHWISGGRVR